MATFETVNIGTATLVGDKAASSSANVLTRDRSGNALMASGNTVPTDASSGYAVGCQFIKSDGGSGNPCNFVNLGSATSSAFRVVGPVAGWNIAPESCTEIACTSGSTVLPVPVITSAFQAASDPAFMHFSTSDDGDYMVEAVLSEGVLGASCTPELSADPLTTHWVQMAWLTQNIVPGYVCTHAATGVATAADAAGVATNDITVTGAAVGDLAFAMFSASDDNDKLGAAYISSANTLTLNFSANPLATGVHTVAYAVFAPVGEAVPAYYIAAAGKLTSGSGDNGGATEVFTVTGALTTDVAIVQLNTKGSSPVTIDYAAVSAADSLTVNFSGDPAADHVCSYMLLRAV